MSAVILSSSTNSYSQSGGSTATDAWMLQGKNVLKKDTSGNVGLGTKTPQEKLDVMGNVRIDGLKGTGTRFVLVDELGKIIVGPPCLGDCNGEHGGKPIVLPPDTMRHDGGKPLTGPITGPINANRGLSRIAGVGDWYIEGDPLSGTDPNAKVYNFAKVGIGSYFPNSIGAGSLNVVSTIDVYPYPTQGWGSQFRFRNWGGGVRHIIADDLTNDNMLIIPGYGGNAKNELSIKGKVLIGNKQVSSASAHYPDLMLSVYGNVIARKYIATELNWADDVFKDDYDLTNVDELQKYATEHHHLPGVPTEKEIKEKGVDLAEMNVILLRKLEEAYLYIFQLNKELKSKK